MAFVWKGKPPSARPATRLAPLHHPTFDKVGRTKKPGPSLLQAASPARRGSPVRLRLSVPLRRLTGLLSGSPSTDTRPQARARLGAKTLCAFPNSFNKIPSNEPAL